MSAPAETVLSIEHAAVHFGGLVAVADITFSVGAGEIVGLIGPNGAGKTTVVQRRYRISQADQR